MSEDQELAEHLRGQIAETHRHCVEMMEERLASADSRELEVYFSLLGKLVEKLERKDLDLREVAQETFTEVAGIIMAELGR